MLLCLEEWQCFYVTGSCLERERESYKNTSIASSALAVTEGLMQSGIHQLIVIIALLWLQSHQWRDPLQLDGHCGRQEEIVWERDPGTLSQERPGCREGKGFLSYWVLTVCRMSVLCDTSPYKTLDTRLKLTIAMWGHTLDQHCTGLTIA